jgi:hypothetical protein
MTDLIVRTLNRVGGQLPGPAVHGQAPEFLFFGRGTDAAPVTFEA